MAARGKGRGLRGPIRGFPPLQGQADPVYPPGQFSPWNRASIRAAWLGMTGPGGADAEPGYSALAVSDPSADATATQTWAVIEDGELSAGGSPARTGREWGSHTGETGPYRHAVSDARPLDAGRPGSAGREPGGAGPGARVAEPSRRGPALGGPATSRESAIPQEREREPAIPRESAIPQEREREPAISRESATRRASRDPDEADGGRRSRTATTRRAGKAGKRHHVMTTSLLLAPVIVVIVVVAGYLSFFVKHAPTSGHTSAPRRSSPAATPSPTLGKWKHIESRAQDSVPLTVTQLFPSTFKAQGVTGARTVDQASTKCSHDVFGSALASAVRKADCTQVLRASYLSTDRKYMATVGVLNLTDAPAAKQAAKASGSTGFIKQLPAKHGPTRRLTQGTGIEYAGVKGHYLILIWTEFTNLHAPSGKSQRAKLVTFSAGLIAGTVNVSLTNRMVTGHP